MLDNASCKLHNSNIGKCNPNSVLKSRLCQLRINGELDRLSLKSSGVANSAADVTVSNLQHTPRT